jgi:hypothetical protein
MAEIEIPATPQAVEQDALAKIAENSQLSNVQMQAALLDACGAPPAAIAKKFGKANNYIYQLRATNPEYKRVVQEFYQVVSRKVVDEVTNIDELFNAQIGPSAACLMEVRDNIWAKDADRIKASLAFLDRASKAPKATASVESRSMIIQIPVSTMREMRGVLGETGEGVDRELLELLEREDGGYEVERNINEDSFIEVKRG